MEEVKIDVERTTTEDKVWSGCCSRSNKEFVIFISQVSFGASLVLFSMIQISRGDVVNKEIYFSLLSLVIGTFLPNPKIKEN
tara:strand:+ start:242 stop:487 length:246 start_codon:yes stop_codon:yes gene_type:complete